MSLIWVLEAILLGCLLVSRFTDLPAIRPMWVRLFLIFGAGAAGGFGLTSCLFFLFGVLFGVPVAAMVLELAVLAWAGYEVFRRRIPVFQSDGGTAFPLLTSIAALILLLALGFATTAIWTTWEAKPYGNWDAWAIWNLRAKFLASDAGLAQRAWSRALSSISQPEYPLLLSSFVGRCWAFGHSFAASVPEATAYVFFLALIALAAGGVALLRGPVLGFLIALALAATPRIVHEVPTQYADVPLACFFVGALVFMLLKRPVLAGILAACAAWTKDEGLSFLILFLVATAVFRRRAALAALAGALPIAAILIFFKTVLSRGNRSLLSASLPGAGHRIADMGRYATIISALGDELRAMAAGWYHPLLPLIVLALVLRFDRERRRDVAYCGAILTALLLSYFGIFVVTNNDLKWQLEGSLGRLLVQVWPSLLLTAFIGLRPPQAAVTVKPVPAPKERRKARGARRGS